MFIENHPDEIALLSFFESEPVSFERENVSFLYTYKNNDNLSIDFSFSIVEGWIQLWLSLDGKEFLQSSVDRVSSFSIRKDSIGEYIYVETAAGELVNTMEIRVIPDIKVKASSLAK
ncbi:MULTISPECIES: hypothetical protein [Enterobacterales]|uniref:hypothetical protein n=1 Tax=Enterobacterales TaxID=91347 RepID=UPI002ED87517